MKFECPYGWKYEGKIGDHLTFESATVHICDGICDSCDLCGIERCEFYDTSREATRRFLRAQAQEHTLEHLLAPIN
ncbi:MAG: hypothetical protein MSG64_20915 [Pyrinomonadaceae bacterium MAG19_C2-C3]|nr:hypothetical protein [Pyrinomonadaceae bacterium MAG19_C2-C3]